MRLETMMATPTPTILLRKHTLPLTSLIPLIMNLHITPATLSFVALLANFLPVTLSGLPYRPGQLRSEFLFCGISSLTLLVLMMVIVVVIHCWRRMLPHLPREPNSVGAVLTYLVDSDMCDDFEGLEKESRRKRDKAIKALGKRYGYGMKEVDGEKRWCVDEMLEETAPAGTVAGPKYNPSVFTGETDSGKEVFIAEPVPEGIEVVTPVVGPIGGSMSNSTRDLPASLVIGPVVR